MSSYTFRFPIKAISKDNEKIFNKQGRFFLSKKFKDFEDNPITKDQPFNVMLDSFENVSHVQVFANKAGIIKTSDQIEGIVLKGVGSDFNWDFFQDYLVKGETFSARDSVVSRKILISSQTATRPCDALA